MNPQRSTSITDRFEVRADDGTTFNVVETSTFVREQELSGRWTPPQLQSKRLTAGHMPVNQLDDGTYEVLTPHPVPCRRL